jgi:hypothetical protein
MNEHKGEQRKGKGNKPLKIDKDVSSSTVRPFLQEEFVSIFYRPHSVTILIIAICAINYFAFLRRRFSLEENIKRGIYLALKSEWVMLSE